MFLLSCFVGYQKASNVSCWAVTGCATHFAWRSTVVSSGFRSFSCTRRNGLFYSSLRFLTISDFLAVVLPLCVASVDVELLWLIVKAQITQRIPSVVMAKNE